MGWRMCFGSVREFLEIFYWDLEALLPIEPQLSDQLLPQLPQIELNLKGLSRSQFFQFSTIVSVTRDLYSFYRKRL
jgi:hypothetical protein